MGLLDRLRNSWNIFLFSFKLLGKDKSLVAIPLILFISPVLLLIIALVTLPISAGTGIYVYYIVLLLIIYFWVTFLAAAQSWMVYEVMKGEDATVGSGFSRALKNILDIFVFAVASIFIILFTSWLKGKGQVGKVVGGTVDFAVGIAKKLVLPSMIITERNFFQASAQLKDSIKAGPEIATYEIGIRPLTSLAFIIGFIISVLAFFVLPIAGIIMFVIWMSLLILVTKYINITYYTIVYLTLIEKRKFKGLEVSGAKLFG